MRGFDPKSTVPGHPRASGKARDVRRPAPVMLRGGAI